MESWLSGLKQQLGKLSVGLTLTQRFESATLLHYAALAQLDRALVCGTKGHKFKSCMPRQKYKVLIALYFLLNECSISLMDRA